MIKKLRPLSSKSPCVAWSAKCSTSSLDLSGWGGEQKRALKIIFQPLCYEDALTDFRKNLPFQANLVSIRHGLQLGRHGFQQKTQVFKENIGLHPSRITALCRRSVLTEICHGSVTYMSRTVRSRVLLILTVTDVRPSRVLPTSRKSDLLFFPSATQVCAACHVTHTKPYAL